MSKVLESRKLSQQEKSDELKSICTDGNPGVLKKAMKAAEPYYKSLRKQAAEAKQKEALANLPLRSAK